jgi:maleate isomerase
MYGWRRRIGLLVPASNTTMEIELHRMMPDGISLHTSRVLLTEGNEEGLRKMNKYATRAASEVATADVDLILYGCTSGSFMKGEAFNKQLSDDLSKAAGVKVITAATGVKRALSILQVKKVCLITPYPENRNVWARNWLQSLGCDVTRTIPLIPLNKPQTVSNAEICRLLPELVYSETRRYIPLEADCLFVSCTNLRTIEIIEALEEDFGIPVVTSNQASLWVALREVGYKKTLSGYGKLLSEH